MLSVQLSTPFLLLSLFASLGNVLPAPTANKPLPACFTSKIDLALKWPATLTTAGNVPVVACNGTVLGQVDDAGLAALMTARIGTLPNHLDVFMPNSTCFLPTTVPASAQQLEAIGSPFNALSTRSVPCGTTLYIPALDGAVLAKGLGTHNGCVRTVNRQAEIASRCQGVLNVGSVEHAALFASKTGETAIEIRDCTPATFQPLSFVSTAGEESDDESEEFDYPDPTEEEPSTTPATAPMTLIQDSSDESASYSLSEAKENVVESGSSDADVEYVDCDENGNPIIPAEASGSGSGNIRYVYVDCDENGNPITTPTPTPAPTTAASGTGSNDDDSEDVTYVDCDENGNPILPSTGSASADEDIVWVDCDASGNPILDSSDEIVYVDCDANGVPILSN